MKWSGQHIYDLVSKFRNTVDFSEDVTFYQPINNGNPTISLGSSATNRLEIKSTYNSGTQALCDIDFTTYTSSSSGNDGRFNFYVDEVQKLVLNDNSLSTFCSVLATVDGAEFQAKDTTASSDGGGGKLTLVCDDGAAMGDDHRLGVIEFKGAEDEDGNTTVGARIEAMCDAAWSSTENGGRLDFYTTDADAGGGKVLTLDSNKQATFGGGVAVTGVITGNAGVVSVETDHLKITSTNANDPLVQIKNETDDASGPRLKFNKLRGADGQDGDSCGIIQFASFDDGTPSTQFYGQIETKIADATSGQEAGDMFFQVPSYDGVLTNGLHLDGDTDADGEVDVNIAAGGASTTTIAGTLSMGSTAALTNAGLVAVASQPNITTLAGLTTIGTTGVNTVINSDDVQLYNPVNNGNPQLSIGASDAERFLIQPIYNTGAQTLNYVLFNTIEAGSTAQKGQYLFQVDSTSILTIRDPGIDLYSNMGISISGTDIITDSSGTATLSNIDALDATTETTIEAAIDTLANLTSIGTIATGVWEGTDIEVAHGGTGASTLTDNAVLLGNGTGAVEASSHLNYYTPTSNQDYLRVGDGSTTLSGIISDNAAPLFISVEGNAGTNAAGSDLTLIAGSGTGSGAGGDILFRSSAASGSGTTVRVTAEIAALDNVGNLQIDGGLTTGSTAAIDNSGVWVGGVIPSAKLDADTAHLSGAQTFTGTKTLNSFKGTAGATVTNILDEDAMGSDSATALATQQSIKAYADRPAKQIVLKNFNFVASSGTTETFFPFAGTAEKTSDTDAAIVMIAPTAGKLLKLYMRASRDHSGQTTTITLYNWDADEVFSSSNKSSLGVQSATGPNTNEVVTFDFTSSLDSGTNAFTALETLAISYDNASAIAGGNTKYFFTAVFEYDFSGY